MDKRSFTIADCFSFIKNGANIKQDKEKRGYPITRIETTSNNVFNRDKVGYAGIEDITPYQDYVLEDGDLLMSHINSLPYLGRIVYYDRKQDETIIHGMNLLRLKAIKARLRPKYATFLFSSIRFKNKILTIAKKSVNQASFSINDLKKVCIELPTIEEQDNIVGKLVRIQTIIQLRNSQLAKLDELVKCRFVELFGDMRTNTHGWENKTLGEACDVRDGTHDSPKYHTHGYPLVTSKNVTQGIIDFSDCNLICEEDYVKISKRSKVDKGDIIMPMIGTVGCPVIVETDELFAIKNVALIKFPDKAQLLNVFVKHLLLSSYFETEVMDKVRGGTQKFISLSDIRKLRVFIPPADLQRAFAAFIHRINKLRFVIRQSLDEKQKLFDSLMQEYFE